MGYLYTLGFHEEKGKVIFKSELYTAKEKVENGKKGGRRLSL